MFDRTCVDCRPILNCQSSMIDRGVVVGVYIFFKICGVVTCRTIFSTSKNHLLLPASQE